MSTGVMDLALIDPAPRNANVMDARTLALLTEALTESRKRGEDMRQPLLVRPKADGKRYEVVDGHHRLEAARAAGYTQVTVVSVDMTDEEAARAAVTMNKLRGELDLGVVGEIFAGLADDGVDPALLAATGFTEEEVDALIRAATDPPDDELPPEMDPAPKRADDELGKTWELEVQFADRKDRDRVRRVARKLGEGDPATGLLRLVELEGDGDDLAALLEVAAPLADWAAGQDEACELAERVQRVISRARRRDDGEEQG